jgi:hypothetical protein
MCSSSAPGKAVRAAQGVGGARRAAVADHAQRADVARARPLLVGQRGEHRGHEQRRGHALGLDQVQSDGRVQRAEHDLAPAVPHGRKDRDRARGVEQRGDDQPAGVGVERPSGLVVQRVGDEVAVREDHALGRAGGATGVEQPGDVVLGDVRREVDRPARSR